MRKYNSFEEFIQVNYIKYIHDDLQLFLDKHKFEFEYIKAEITSIQITWIEFTKSEIEKVEFNVYFKTKILFQLTEEKGKHIQYFFIYPMKGSFKKGFKSNNRKLELLEKEKEIYSNGLVPIIHSEDLDRFAAKFLKICCKEALKTPMKLNIVKIFKEQNITVYKGVLDSNIFGKTYFADDQAEVYDADTNEIKVVDVHPGTILINWEKHTNRPDGALRNTIIHEAVHWFFHRNYFELRQCLDHEVTSVTCYKGNVGYESSDIAWMEWQARSLAPRILMPKTPFLKKFKEVYAEWSNIYGDMISKPAILQNAVSEVADFFGVSRVSAKYRLNELGEYIADGVLNYVDGEYIRPFMFKKGSLQKHESFVINDEELARLLTSDFIVRDALFTEKVLYANKMLVANNPKYVDYKTKKLTEYALEHADECCLKFRLPEVDYNDNEQVNCIIYLNSQSKQQQRNRETDPEQATRVTRLADESSRHYEAHKHLIPPTFGETLEYHFKKSKTYTSYDKLGWDCDVSGRTIRNYRDGTTLPSRINIIKISLALRLSAPYIIDLLKKADEIKTNITPENTILYSMIFGRQRVGLVEVYKDLRKVGCEWVLEMSDNWINENIFD